MNIQYFDNNSSVYFINTFSTNRDPYNTRKNFYIDIRYGELVISFNENKVIFDLTFHIAGNFNLPPGCLNANIIMPGQTITSINLFKQQNTIPADFQYGFPDASSIYTGRVILDTNEDNFLYNNENSSYQINTNFSINTSQLSEITFNDIDPITLSNFISDINNITLKFDVNLYQKNEYDLTTGTTFVANQIHSIWVSSQVQELNNNIIYGDQKNIYLPFQFIGYNYLNITNPIKELFGIKKMNNTNIKIEVEKLKVGYIIDDKLYETNELSLNSNTTITSNFYTFSIDQIQLQYDTYSNSYKLDFGNNGIYFEEDTSGYYFVTLIITIDGTSRKYSLKNNFSFVRTNQLKISYLSNNSDLKILDTDFYYEIEE